MFRINKWSETFESADTRKRQRLGWILLQSGCDSRGYRKLMRDGKEGLQSYAVFIAMCQYMATLPKDVRGEFLNSDGSPMDIYDISEVTRIDVADIQQAYGRLIDCGWLTLVESTISQSSASDLPPSCQPHPAFVQGEGEGEGEEEEEGEEQVDDKDLIEEIYQAYPKKVGKGSALKAIKKAIKIIEPNDLLEIVKIYSTKVDGKDKKFIPHPSTWFNDMRWEDDQSTWEKPTFTQQQTSTPQTTFRI